MADRQGLVVIKNDSNNAEKGVLITVSEDGNTLSLRRDTTYDVGGDLELAVNVYNVAPFVGSHVDFGVDSSQLQGNGVTLTWDTDNEINIQFVARTAGAWVKGTSRTLTPYTGPYQRITNGNNSAMFEIAEDGWLRPDFLQSSSWPASVRTLSAPRAITHRYTDLDRVKVVLRAPENRTSGWEADFTDRLNDIISSVENDIDAYCGRSFGSTTAESRDFRVANALAIELDDVDLSQSVAVTFRNRSIPATDWEIRRDFTSLNVGRFLRPVRNRWYPESGYYVSVNATWGINSVPPEVRDFATRYAAEVFDADAAAHGLVGVGDGGAMYASRPGKLMSAALGHLRLGTRWY